MAPSRRPLATFLVLFAAALLPFAAAQCKEKGTSCLWKEYLEVDPGAGDAPLQGRAIAPDDSSVIEACSDEQWANNPDGGKPEERKFNPDGSAIPNIAFDGNGSHHGKYKYWPDCRDFEEDIKTTCEELARTTCPLKEDQSSLLCEWKAKGATNWMVKTTFFGTAAADALLPAGESSANPGAAGDWTRMSFHDAGQFFLNGSIDKPQGDDASLWYEVSQYTAPPMFRPNFEMLAQTMDSRKKVYRPINRCGAKPSEACRYPCETICDYKDETTFPHFKEDGSVKSSCSDEPEVEVPILEEPDLVVRQARFADVDRPQTGTARPKPRRSGGGAVEASRGADLKSASRPGSRGLLQDSRLRPPGPYYPRPFETPFAQDPNWQTMPAATCYSQCKTTCKNYFEDSNRRVESEPGYAEGSNSVKCTVAFADVLQYASASSTEITGGPKLMRRIKPGRCDVTGPDDMIGLPAAFGQSVKDMTTQIPFFKECKCGGAAGLTAITGSHTLGHAHSRRVSSDCEELIPGSTEKSRNMDRTPFVFDNDFWKGLTRAQCNTAPENRVAANAYATCTSPYLTEDWLRNSWTSVDSPSTGFSSDDALFFKNRKGKSIRCVNVTNENENTCSESVCSGGCKTMEETSGCTCNTCNLGDKAHCTGRATCGTFHSDQMLWATKETAHLVLMYANSQDEFFKDYEEAHVRMAHIGCEFCGPNSHLKIDTCA